MGNETIEAYVTEVKTRVPLMPDDEPADIILKAEYAEFLAQTKMDELKSEVNLRLTSPGKYPLLLEHIEVHRFFLGVELGREIPYDEAVIHWYDEVYQPTLRLIRETGLIRDFPERTEADMYVWLADHRAEVEQMLGWEVSTEKVVVDMAANFGSYNPSSLASQELQIPLSGDQDSSSAVGRWRRERLSAIDGQHFLKTLMIPIRGDELDWWALDQAIAASRREGSHIYGLFAVTNESEMETILTRALRAEFERRCADAGVPATFIVEVGDLEKLVSERGRWADVLVLRQMRDAENTSKLDPMFLRTIRRSSGPLLIVAEQALPLDNVLLAYDDRPESHEALYMAAYLGERWEIPITLLHVDSGNGEGDNVADRAFTYLSDLITESNLVVGTGNVTDAILSTAEERQCNLIVMGAPRLNPMFELVLGSTVKEMVERTQFPLLLCR
jgi:nucleotide-binding universal stress UspA family protein